MSYILDALRRADAERERGAVPGLHSQPTAPVAAVPPRRRLPAAAIATAALGALVLIGAIGWTMLAREPVQPVVPAPVAATVMAPPAATAPATVPARTPPPVAAVPKPARPAAVVAEAPAEVPALPPAPASQAAPAQPRITSWERLPDDVRRQLPTLAIGGAIYSDNPASRMLIVSGQLLHEGDTAAPGVTLELIRQHSAVLRWKDLRYEVSF